MKTKKAKEKIPHVVVVLEGGLLSDIWIDGNKGQRFRVTKIDHDCDEMVGSRPEVCDCDKFGGKEHYHSTWTEGE